MDEDQSSFTTSQVDGKAFGANNAGSTPADLTAAVLAMEGAYTRLLDTSDAADEESGVALV